MHLTRVGGGVESREWKIEIRKMGDSQTFVKALSDWSSKIFFGQEIICSLYPSGRVNTLPQ